MRPPGKQKNGSDSIVSFRLRIASTWFFKNIWWTYPTSTKTMVWWILIVLFNVHCKTSCWNFKFIVTWSKNFCRHQLSDKIIEMSTICKAIYRRAAQVKKHLISKLHLEKWSVVNNLRNLNTRAWSSRMKCKKSSWRHLNWRMESLQHYCKRLMVCYRSRGVGINCQNCCRHEKRE